MASKWNIFERAEITLERTLKKNPTYPFQVLYTDSEGGLVYAYSKRMAYFYFGSLGCVTSLFFVLFLILFSEGNKVGIANQIHLYQVWNYILLLLCTAGFHIVWHGSVPHQYLALL